MSKRRTNAGIARCPRDATVKALAVGFRRPARQADGNALTTGFSLIMFVNYRPGDDTRKTWQRFKSVARSFEVILERIGDADGPPDSVRANGAIACPHCERNELECHHRLYGLASHPLCRLWHLDAPCSVVSATGSGAEKPRSRNNHNHMPADEKSRLKSRGYAPEKTVKVKFGDGTRLDTVHMPAQPPKVYADHSAELPEWESPKRSPLHVAVNLALADGEPLPVRPDTDSPRVNRDWVTYADGLDGCQWDGSGI